MWSSRVGSVTILLRLWSAKMQKNPVMMESLLAGACWHTVVFPVNVRKIEVSTDDDGVVRVVHSPGADVQERGIKQLQIFIVARWWSITKRSENDTPQPLDQWTSSPFIGQQVANCKSFTLTLYLADLFAMHHGPRSIPLCAQHHIQLTPLHSKWVKPPIPELQQFQYFTLKIQGQGHGWGQSLKSQCESNILSTHIPFVPCQSDIPFLRYDFLKIWPWNPRSRSWKRWTLKVTTWVQHSIDWHPFRSMSIGHPIPEIGLSQNLTLKSKVKVMEEVNIESHNMGPTFYRLTSLSFHVD